MFDMSETTQTYKITGKAPFIKVEAKLGNMRKPDSFLIYPKEATSSQIRLQTNSRFAWIDPFTRTGRISTKGNRMIDTMEIRGGIEITVDQALIDAIQAVELTGPVQIT